MNGLKVMDHDALCVWKIEMTGVCFDDFPVFFTIGTDDAELILAATAMFTVTYRGPPPTELLDVVHLTKIMGRDFCIEFPGTIDVIPVCN